MKLIGNTKKDYFDYLIHQYGVDPLVVLDRRPLIPLSDYGYFPPKIVDRKYVLKSNVVIKKDYRIWDKDAYVNDFLVVNGIVYHLVETKDNTYVLANDSNTDISKYIWMKVSIEPYFSEKMVELSKELNRHCFIISNAAVKSLMPNLGDLGFGKLISPQDMYLQTVDFITHNLTKKVEQDVTMGNKEKIISHGFDLKTSFRGKQ